MLYKKNITLLIVLFAVTYTLGQQTPSVVLDTFITRTPVLHTGEKPEDIIQKNLFVRAASGKKNVFVGEPFLVTYKLYTTLNRSSNTTKQPAFNGCSVLELPSDNDPLIETVEGKKYEVLVIRKVQLTPLTEGPLQLGEASVENIVSFIHAEDAGQFQDYTVTLTNKPLTVNVNPLPEKNKPAGFYGVVGNFTIGAKVDTNTAAAGENIHLQITISGSGNLGAINLPNIQWPSGIEHFDGTDSQHTDVSGFPVKGSKIFDLSFIGTNEDNVVIPPINFCFFDPSSHTYKIIASEKIPVAISKAQPAEEINKNIVTEDISNRKYLWIVPAIGMLVLIIFLISNQANKKKNSGEKKQVLINGVKLADEKITNEKKLPVIKNDFKVALKNLKNINGDNEFFTSAKILLTQALQEKLHSDISSESSLIIALREDHQNAHLVNDATKIYAACDLALYSPVVEDDKRSNLHAQLSSLIEALNI